MAGHALAQSSPISYELPVIEVQQTDAFSRWLGALRDRKAAARIAERLRRLAWGNPGDAKPVGEGVSELRVDYGPGYRVYTCNAAQCSWSCCAAVTRQARRGTSPAPRPWFGR